MITPHEPVTPETVPPVLCQCAEPQGWAVYVGRGAGWIVCAKCGFKVRKMTEEDWGDF